MKRYFALGAVALVLAAAGWGAFWWSGRAEVENALDAGIARLQERGWTIAWDGRDIGGFPFGYAVSLSGLNVTDAGSGVALRLPWAVAETHGTDRIVIRMPESFAADLPMPQAAQAQMAEDGAPAALQATGESDELILVLAADGTVEITADRLAWTVGEAGIGRRVTQTVEGLEATSVPDAPGARYRLRAASLVSEAELAETGAEATPSTAVATLRDVVVEGSSTLGSPKALGEMLYAGGPGQAQGSLATGPAEVRVVSIGDAPGEFDWRAEGTSGRAMLTSGRMELEAETRGNAWTLSSADPSVPVRGRISVALARGFYAMPMAPAGEPEEMAIRLSLDGATADEQIWAQLDPEGVLPRDPAALSIDLAGTVRVTERIDRLRPGAPPPFEISTLEFREVFAEALGATANATGEIEILQPVGVPLGQIQLGITGLESLVGSLGRSGVLAPQMVTMANAIMDVYLRPAAGEDAWTAEIDLTREGPLVNGKPVR